MKKAFCIPLLFAISAISLFSQSNPARPVNINLAAISQALVHAPGVFDKGDAQNAPTIVLPLPDGSTKSFRMYQTQPMHPDLAAKYPGIQTYHGKCEADGISTVALTLSPGGLQAMVLDDNFQTAFIEPAQKSGDNLELLPDLGEGNYVTYFDTNPEFHCQHTGESSSTVSSQQSATFHNKAPISNTQSQQEMMTNNPLALGDKLRTHRFAVAATGEFTQANGGTPATVMPVVVAMVNAINLLYIKEFAINFQLVANTDLLFFTDPNTDPYTSTGHWDPDLAINQTTTDNIIGSANYDIGHLMQLPLGCPGCGGWAGWGPCNANKASGMSVNSFTVIRHEMGHQFFCPHTTDPPFPERYEHGAIGNTIMGGNAPDNVFHIYSANRVATWVETPGYCIPGTNTNNSIPMVTVGTGGMSIPKSTPFQLSGSATDPDPNTTLLYNWQQFDNEINYTVVNNRIIPAGNTPVFRNFNPSPTGNVRTIPRLQDLVSNTYPFGLSGSDTLNWETLPDYSRSVTFRLVARDYELTGGAYDYGELTFLVDGNSGPFVVTSPNTGNPTWTAGNNVTVTWDVANTDNAPVSCANVNIKLSIDGGFTYPYTLAANTLNDGTHTFLLSNAIPANTAARVRVECATYTNVVFFDISNQNFTISSPCVANGALIAPIVDVTAAQGAPALDLNLAPLYGNASGTANFNVVEGPDAFFALFNEAQTACLQGCCQFNFTTVQFQVDKAGTYTFEVNYDGGGTPGFFSVHSGNFNPASVCDGFITANWKETSGGVSGVSPIQGTFTPGTTYTMMFTPWFGDDTASGTVSFTSSNGGNVVVLGQGQPAPPVSDYSYTYVAVNTATGLIAAVNAGADFTALPGGTYRVYGMSYKSANPPPAVVNPASLVGLSLEGVFATSQCIHFSGNFVNVTVTGGCTLAVFASTDVPKAISASGTPTVTSTLSIPVSGTISDVNVLNLDIDHTYINDLRVKLKSPANTERILLNQICNNQDNILISFDDESSNTYASIPCPPNGVMHQPNQTLSPFDGENLAGTWTLTIEDMADQDGGTLQAWSIEVCYNSCPDILPVNSNPVLSGTYEAQQAITSAGTIANNGNVLFKAGTSVELLPNFEIIIGGVFEVIMVGCIP